MNHPVLNALLPVVLLIAIGCIAGHAKLISVSGVKDLSTLVFMVVLPALLFRTMAQVHPEAVNGASLLAYFGALWLLFGATLAVVGFTRRGAVLALATTFSNSVMMGIALIGIAYGAAGLAVLLPIVSLHALVMLTMATIVLEFALLREQGKAVGSARGNGASMAHRLASSPQRHHSPSANAHYLRPAVCANRAGFARRDR
jgi:malonate transporter and related proteins